MRRPTFVNDHDGSANRKQQQKFQYVAYDIIIVLLSRNRFQSR